MAQFPGAVPSFTTKQDGPGNTIQAAYVNDLQTEVVALADGYLNATARLNAGASTVASLSVSGASTLAGPVTIGSTATLNVGGSVGTANQALLSNGSSGVVWGTIALDSSLAVTALSTTATAASTDTVLLCLGTWTLSLFTAVGNRGKVLYVKNKSTASTGIITVTPNNSSEAIDGSTALLVYPGEDFPLVSDNANWWIL